MYSDATVRTARTSWKHQNAHTTITRVVGPKCRGALREKRTGTVTVVVAVVHRWWSNGSSRQDSRVVPDAPQAPAAAWSGSVITGASAST